MARMVNAKEIETIEVLLFMVEHQKSLREAYAEMGVSFDLRVPPEEFKRMITKMLNEFVR